jgi:hypothetical protein
MFLQNIKENKNRRSFQLTKAWSLFACMCIISRNSFIIAFPLCYVQSFCYDELRQEKKNYPARSNNVVGTLLHMDKLLSEFLYNSMKLHFI